MDKELDRLAENGLYTYSSICMNIGASAFSDARRYCKSSLSHQQSRVCTARGLLHPRDFENELFHFVRLGEKRRMARIHGFRHLRREASHLNGLPLIVITVCLVVSRQEVA